jgi:hypothetical protein
MRVTTPKGMQDTTQQRIQMIIAEVKPGGAANGVRRVEDKVDIGKIIRERCRV